MNFRLLPSDGLRFAREHVAAFDWVSLLSAEDEKRLRDLWRAMSANCCEQVVPSSFGVDVWMQKPRRMIPGPWARKAPGDVPKHRQ